MTISRRWVLTSVFCALGALTAACGATTKNEQSGPDVGGSTHWLAKCKDDSECGSNLCYLGVCTLPCVRSSECSANGNAECVSGVVLTTDPEGRTCRTDASVCLVPCDSSASCGSGQTCSDGFCVGSRASCSAVGSVAHNSDADASALGAPSASGLVAPFDSAVEPFPSSTDAQGIPSDNIFGPSPTPPEPTITLGSEPSPSSTDAQGLPSDFLGAPSPPVPSDSTDVPAAPSNTAWITPPPGSASPRALVGQYPGPVPVTFVNIYAPSGYCDSNTVEGLSSSLMIVDADTTSYKLVLQTGEQDCELGCTAEGLAPYFATLVAPVTYPIYGFALETGAQPCGVVDGGGGHVCLPRHDLPWGEYTLQYCAYPGELEFPDGTRDILCKRTSDEPVCVSGSFKYPTETEVYLTMPEVP